MKYDDRDFLKFVSRFKFEPGEKMFLIIGDQRFAWGDGYPREVPSSIVTNHRILAIAYYALAFSNKVKVDGETRLEEILFLEGEKRDNSYFLYVNGKLIEGYSESHNTAADITAYKIEQLIIARRKELGLPSITIKKSAKQTDSKSSGEEPQVKVKEIIREIVKVPCKYCGNLNEITSSKCQTCGAPMN